jgi:hypothetical protein
MKLSTARDESLLAFYESVRRQVEADLQSAGAIVSSVSPQSNTQTTFAKKWTDDE